MRVFRYFDELDQKTYLLLQKGPHWSVYTLTLYTVFKDDTWEDLLLWE